MSYSSALIILWLCNVTAAFCQFSANAWELFVSSCYLAPGCCTVICCELLPTSSDFYFIFPLKAVMNALT